MRILFLSDDFPPNSFGGAGIVAFSYAQMLQKLGHQVTVITTIRNKQEESIINYEGVTIYRLYADYHERWRSYVSIFNPQCVRKVEKILRDLKPDIVHAHNIHYYLSYHCLSIAKRYSQAVFLTAHDTMAVSYGKILHSPDSLRASLVSDLKEWKFRYNFFRNLFIKRYLNRINKVFAISNALADFLRANGITNVTVLYNGVDTSQSVTNEEVQEFKKTYNLEDKKVVLFGGRISALKGGEKIVRSFSHVVKEVPEAILLIVGTSNSYTQNIMSLVSQLKIQDNVQNIGWQKRELMEQIFKSCDVCVTPSIYFDAFNMFNIEAMAASKPVVGTCFGGTPEIVSHAKSGYIVDPNDEEALAGFIIKLLKDPALSAQFGSWGRERVEQEFDLRKQTEKLIKCYKQVLLKNND